MGNSMRSFLGNMCGAEDSKRLANEADPDNRPLPNDAKPKEEQAEEQPKEQTKDDSALNEKEKSFQTCSVETAESHTPLKRKHRSSSQRRYSGLYEVDAFKPESTNQQDADQIYTKSAEQYQPFVDECTVLRKAIDSLEAVFTNDKKRIDFENAMTQLNELIQKSNNENETVNTDKLSAGQEHHATIVTSGKRVLELIDEVRPSIDNEVEQASKLDIKESKNKHKRNLKHLKQCQTHITTVTDETKDILTIAEKVPVIDTPKTQQNPQEPSEDTPTATSDNTASSPTVVASEPIAINPTQTESNEKDDTKTPTDDSSHLQEEALDVPSTLSTSPIPESLPKHRTASLSSITENGRLIDYGSFWMLNPSNDEMALIKRSRSLDSLVSRGSRSSMSRCGSYELVTNMEIQIAEKSESAKAAQPESS